MTDEPKKPLPEQAAGFPWHQSCGCATIVVTFLLLCWLGGATADVLRAFAEWLGRH